MTSTPTSTQKINRPVQKRARATRQRILDSTLSLLAEAGIDRISTNVIARHAGVNIATLYKYFPDKFSILHELALDFGRHQTELICAFLDTADPETPMETVIDGMIDCYIDDTRGNPAAVHLQRSLIVYPELQDTYRATNLDIGPALVPFLQRWGISLSGEQLDLAMICHGEVASALQDLALTRSPTYDPAVVAELKYMIRAYFRARVADALAEQTVRGKTTG